MQKLSHTDKFSKDQVFRKLLDLKKSPREMSDYELDGFINYFAPSLPKSPKSAFQWVAKAVASNDVRKYLEYVNVENKVAVATDGVRLHFATVDMPDGCYCPKTGLSVDPIGNYPDWRRIVPKCAAPTSVWSDSASTVGKKPIFVTTIDGFAYNREYLADALADQSNARQTLNEGVKTVLTGNNTFGTYVVACRRA